jgi:uncharacterized protein (DUF2062 family)
VLGLVATVLLSAVLGYFSPVTFFGTLGSILAAIAGGVILYFVILAVLVYWYQPRRNRAGVSSAKPSQP